MLNEPDIQPPKLQDPGKGLPKIELLMARLIVGWKAKRTSRNQVATIFELEKAEILKLANNIDPVIGRKQVLIKRLRGLEDSSRFWSIYMTIDHLNIVNKRTNSLILALATGKKPNHVPTGTAAVKPTSAADFNVIKEFQNISNNFQETIQVINNLDTKLTWPHPWFGELNAERWHFFTAFHMSLHKKQILNISKQLRNS
jgi:hypothetical protein